MMKNIGILWVAGLSLAMGACGTEDGDEDTGAVTIGMTSAPTGGADDDGSGGDDGGDTAGTAGGDDGAGSTAAADDDMGDTASADDAPATCDPPCAADQMCVAGNCLGGGDDSTGEPVECGTNVGTGNMACDDCSHANCCAELQACFGDETVVMATPCLELNNCIAMNCNGATTIMELQTCVDKSCAETADQLQTFLAMNQCVATSCAAQCAG